METGQSAGKSYAYLLGVYLGDGCVTLYNGKPAFKLNTIDEDFALATKKALEALTDVPVKIWKHSVKKSSKPNYSLCCADSGVCNALTVMTMDKGIIPSFICDESYRELVIGLMDSEGFVAKKTGCNTGRSYYMGFKSCDIWVPELISIMQSIGLRIGKIQTEKPRQRHYKAPTRFHIKMQSWVDSGLKFNIKRKQDRVDRWAATQPYTERSVYPRKLTSETTRQTPKGDDIVRPA